MNLATNWINLKFLIILLLISYIRQLTKPIKLQDKFSQI